MIDEFTIGPKLDFSLELSTGNGYPDLDGLFRFSKAIGFEFAAVVFNSGLVLGQTGQIVFCVFAVT